MRWIVAAWLISAGIGVAYSVVADRKNQVRFLGEMEHSLRQMAYYMYQWRLPVEEAIKHTAKEENGMLTDFYLCLHRTVTEKQSEDFGKIWKEKSRELLKGQRLTQETENLWCDCFLTVPMEAEALNRRILLRAEGLKEHRESLEEKYKGEQKLVLTLGFFVSAFLCLILW